MLKHKGTCEIKTHRLVLRKYRQDDAEDMFYNWSGDERVCEYLAWRPHENLRQSEQKIKKWIDKYENEDYYHWVIEFEGQAIGDIAVRDLSEQNMYCDVGYCIGKKFWGMGIATEALSAVIKFLFERVGFNRIGAWHEAENTASGRVMEKCGMAFEGTARKKDRRYDGDFCDMKMYGILKKDFVENTCKKQKNQQKMYA